MRKFAKSILIAAGVFLAVYFLAILGLNIYLQSEGLRKRIQVAVESAAGSVVQIQGIHYTPWSGFSISGVSVGGKFVPGRQPFLEASSARFRFSLISLLQGKLLVSEVVVAEPLLVLYAGQPELLPRIRRLDNESSTGFRTEVVGPPVAGAEISVPVPALPPPRPLPAVEVKRIRIVGGTAKYFDSKGALAVAVTGVEVSGDMIPGSRLSGTFCIAEAAVGASMRLKNVKGSFVWDNGLLVIPDLQAVWADGRLTGSVEVGPDGGFSVAAVAEGVLIKALAADAGINGEGTRGSVQSKGSLTGVSGKPETFAGRVDISLQEARFQPLDFIRQIGDLMNIQELRMFELKTAEAGLTIHDKKVTVEALVLESENLVLDAKGPVGFDGKMKLQARLHLNERLRKNLGGLLSNKFKDSERAGYQLMPFSITGTVSRPKTDLLDKLTGFHIGDDVGGLLKNLFRALPQNPKGGAEKQPEGG